MEDDARPPPPYEEAVASSNLPPNHRRNSSNSNNNNRNNDTSPLTLFQSAPHYQARSRDTIVDGSTITPMPPPALPLPAADSRLTPCQSAPPYHVRRQYFSSAEEELAALQEFAQSKLYITPEADGTWGGSGSRAETSMRTIELKLVQEQLKRERLELLESRKRAKEARRRQKEEASKAKAEAKAKANTNNGNAQLGGAGAGGEEGSDSSPSSPPPPALPVVNLERSMSVGDRVGITLKKVLSRGGT